MNRQNVLWTGAAIVVASVTVSGVLLGSSYNSGAEQSASSKQSASSTLADNASASKNSKVNNVSSSSVNFQQQLQAYAASRAKLSGEARRAAAQNLIDQLKQDAGAGRLDPQRAAGIADMLWPDAEPDAAKRDARREELHERLLDMEVPDVPPSPQREQQDRSYAEQSQKIIADVTASVPD